MFPLGACFFCLDSKRGPRAPGVGVQGGRSWGPLTRGLDGDLWAVFAGRIFVPLWAARSPNLSLLREKSWESDGRKAGNRTGEKLGIRWERAAGPERTADLGRGLSPRLLVSVVWVHTWGWRAVLWSSCPQTLVGAESSPAALIWGHAHRPGRGETRE